MIYNNYEELQKEMLKCERVNFDLDKINEAYKVAEKAHETQFRMSGEPYIIHPISVAGILYELGMDTDSICAGLLHDVVEDTDMELEELQKLFGEDVANLVDGLTKIGQIALVSKEEIQAENIRRMLLAMSNDVRVIIIKLADRLHNMRTLEFKPEHKRRYTSLETMEVYAPIAHRLGISALKEELEDIAFRYLDPIAYGEIEKTLEMNELERMTFVNSMQDKIQSRLLEYNVEAHMSGRVKSRYGIYQKVYMAGRSFEEIYDIYAIRVIVETDFECYNILGVVHDIFRPIPNRFKDYISTPKPNRYQSLHTTVIGREGIPFEIQIRTWDMHQTSEYGVAAHWKYKAGINKRDNLEETLAWVRQIIKSQQESEGAEDIVKTIKTDLASDEVFVLTPKGDVKCLPVGSTIIDYAYAIHTGVGNSMVGAKVNSKIVSFDTVLLSGQIIEIMTTKSESKGPSREWINIAKTSEARNKIRSWFKKERKEENIASGKDLLDTEFKRNYINLTGEKYIEFLELLVKRQKSENIEDLYATIGYGGITLSKIMPRIKDDYQKFIRPEGEDETSIHIVEPPKIKSISGVVIENIDNCLVKFSQCCNPLPGDTIVGFVTRGHGVSIHKKDCINHMNSIENAENIPRWVDAYFAEDGQKGFRSTINIFAGDRDSLIADISVAIAGFKVPIHELVAREMKDMSANIIITISINDVNQLNNIISRLKQLDGIISVERSGK